MRPVELSMKGLRSYCGEQRIDFRGKSLVAVVGNTGAGKSSILEGICYGLFAKTTWSGNASRSLISDGARTMVVRFTFEIDGAEWFVERSTSKTPYPAPVHRLLRPGDPTWVPITGEDAVTAEVERLTRLTYKSFKSAVLLAQNQFSTLLLGRDGVRTEILREVFGLDDIHSVHQRADAALERLRPTLAARVAQRAALHPSPAEAAAEVAHVLASARADLERLAAVRANVSFHQAIATANGSRAAQLRLIHEQLAAAATDDVAGEFATVLERDAEIAVERAAVVAAQEQARTEVEGRAEALASADDAGMGDAVMRSAERGITALIDEGAGLQARLQADAAEEARLGDERSRLEAEERKRPARQAAVATAGATFAVATIDHKAAQDLYSMAFRLANVAVHAARSVAATTAEAATRDRAVGDATFERVHATAAADTAAHGLAAARAELAAISALHSAAQAAHGCAPGDPCPVCTRPLPPGFAPPEVPALEARQHAVAEADRAASAAHGKVQRVAATLEAAEREARTVAGRLQAERTAAADSLRALREVIPDAEVGAEADGIVAPVVAAGVRAQEARAVAEAACTAATRDLDIFDTALRSATRALAVDVDRHARSIGETTTIAGRLAAARASVPEPFRPAQDADDMALEVARSAIRTEVTRLGAHRAAHQAAVLQMGAAATRLAKVESQHAVEVTAAAASLWRRVLRHHTAIEAAAAGLGEPVEPLADGGDLATQHRMATSTRATAAAIRASVAAAVQATDGARGEAERAVVEHLVAADMATLSDLDAAEKNAAVAVELRSREEARFRGEIEPAARLDAAIGPAVALEGCLDAIRKWTPQSGKFVQFVSGERQRNLLDIGSDILHRMTQERLRFSPDFEVVATATGQTRPTATLSGGESFLASLALALALVEVNGRGGGTMDTLILDEGFASLDDESLHLALDELSRRSTERGSFVGVVSHLGAVAQAADDVLYVTSTPAGSVAQWRDDLSPEAVQAVEAQLHWD